MPDIDIQAARALCDSAAQSETWRRMLYNKADTLIPALCDELEAARAVVDKLPKTADGGSPMPGDTIYYVRLIDPELLRDERTVQSATIKERHPDHLILESGGWLHISDAYIDSTEASIRAAAEAAKAKEGKK